MSTRLFASQPRRRGRTLFMNSIIARVAMALLIDYSSVYYIDLKTNHYECYSTNQGVSEAGAAVVR